VNEETERCFHPQSMGDGLSGLSSHRSWHPYGYYRDLEQLVETLSDLDDNPRHRKGSGRQACQKYLGRFTSDAAVKRVLELYRSALAHPLPEPDPEGDVLGPGGLLPFRAST
jgi:hypothetical protein